MADVRSYLDGRVGRDAYDAGHLPGAVFVDLDEALAAHTDPAAGGRHPLPTPEHFAAALAKLGIGDDDVVVAYDDAGGVMAARLVWMLRATGRQAALLDGGIQAWDGPLETAAAAARAGALQRPAVAAGAAGLDRRGRRHDRQRRHRRAPARALPRRPGRARPALRPHPRRPQPAVPREPRRRTAASSPPTTCARSSPRSASPARSPSISYCGSGVTACHNLLALEHAGLGAGRLFPGSWSQWSRDPDRPLET